VTVSVAGDDPFPHTASFRLTTADVTPGVLISTLADGYLTIWATGLGAVVASDTFQITQAIPVVRVGCGPPQVRPEDRVYLIARLRTPETSSIMTARRDNPGKNS
jgi:hypothetical protein